MINGNQKVALGCAVEVTSVYIGSLSYLRLVEIPEELAHDDDGEMFGKWVTLDEIQKIVKERNGYDGVLTVFVERPLSGEVYEYGARGEYWDKIGDLIGFA